MFNAVFNFVQARGDCALDFWPAAYYYLPEAMHDLAIPEALATSREEGEETSSTFGAMVVQFRPAIRWRRKELEQFCAQNRDLRIEQTAKGEIIIMPPTSIDTGWQNANLTTEFVLWARKHGGVVGDSDTGFTMPKKGMRAPDVSWISQDRFDKLPKRERKRFAKICPDFVLELRSASDRLPKLHEKMVEYLANGARLGWLIDPLDKQVFVYRPDAPVEHLVNPATLSGDPVLAGFTLDLTRVW